MNQPRPHKKTTETLPSFRQNLQHPTHIRRDTHTPQPRSRTPRKRNMHKHKKTPLKQQLNEQKRITPVNQVPNSQKQHSFTISSKDQPTLCSTTHIKITDVQSCKQCPINQVQIKTLHQQLDHQSELNRELSDKYHELKDSYEKKVKKYKVKNKLLKDQLKLLKWILGQRKEFSEVLQQIQIFKDRKGFEGIQIRQDCKKDINMDKQQRACKKDPSYKIQPQTYPQTHILRDSSQLQQQLSILEQKVMQLTIKNQFLQKIKLKPQQQSIEPRRYSFSQQQNNRMAFSHQRLNQGEQSCQNKPSDSSCERMPLHHQHLNSRYSFEGKSYQYSEDEESLSKEKDKQNERGFRRQNCWNAASKYIRRQVESRYMSPLKEILTEDNFRQSSLKRQSSSRKQQLSNENYGTVQIPESRSRYFESIKQRSRLLGL